MENQVRKQQLLASLDVKRRKCYKNHEKARKSETKAFWRAKVEFSDRVMVFQSQIINLHTKRFGELDWFLKKYRNADWWKQLQADRRETGKLKFLNTRYYSP